MPAPARSYLLCTAFAVLGCGDDAGSNIDAGPNDVIDGGAVGSDALNGVVCANAEASYTSPILNPSAVDDGTQLQVFIDLNSGTPPDRLRLSLNTTQDPVLGTITLPDASWAVDICVDDGDSSCSVPLKAYSGTLQVSSASDRFQGSITEVIFVDDLATPTCSSAIAQGSFDIAIEGPP